MANEKIYLLYFIFHVRDIIARKYKVVGIKNIYTIYSNIVLLNKVEELIDFKSFLDKYKNFEQHYTSNLGRDIWNGLNSLKLALGSMISNSSTT